jgi:putative heme-binding domain-containing protein
VLDGVEQGQILPRDFDAVRRRRLTQHSSPLVRRRAARLLADTLSPDRQKVVESFQKALELAGDPARGREVFIKTCANCHRMADAGRHIGPDIASIGDKSPGSLLIAILDPNRAVESRFTDYLVETRDGQSVNGILAAETGNAITLHPAGSDPLTLLRTDIKSMRATGVSLMPEGLESGHTPQDIADLIAFLRTSPSAVAKWKTFEGNTPRPIHPGEEGILRLPAATAEIYGTTLVLEKQYGNLGYWSSEDDRAVWTLLDVKPGRYAVWLEYACSDEVAGNTFLIESNGQALLTGRVEGTGGWDNYRKISVGAVTLKGGEQRITFRSAGKIDNALIDLRAVELVPPNRK